MEKLILQRSDKINKNNKKGGKSYSPLFLFHNSTSKLIYCKI